jgi:predicted transcriptional regulator
MTVKSTSRASYKDAILSGAVNNQAAEILKVLMGHKPMSLQEIKARTPYEINAISGRVNDLKKMGLVFECDKRKCSVTQRTITPVSTTKESQ